MKIFYYILAVPCLLFVLIVDCIFTVIDGTIKASIDLSDKLDKYWNKK